MPLQTYQEQHPTAAADVSIMDSVPSILFWVLGLIVFVIVLRGIIFTVSQQTVEIVERLGRFKKVVGAGLNFKLPFVDSRVGTLVLRIQELSEEVLVKSKDNSFLTVPVKVQFQVLDGKAKDAFYNLSNPFQQMKSYITNVIRSTVATMTMDDVYEGKETLETKVKEILSEKFGTFGYSIVNVLVDNPLPSQEVIDASNTVIASKRKKEAAENEAEAIRVVTVGKAKAEAESLTLKAEAYVKQRSAMADFFKDLPAETGAYLMGIDYRDMVRDAAKEGTVVIVPSNEAGNDIGKIMAAISAGRTKE